LGVPVELIPYNAAGKVFDDAASGNWDIAFVAIEPVRASVIEFSAPYVIIEGTYMVRNDSPLADLAAGDVLIVADEELAGFDPVTLAPLVSRASAVVVIGTVLPAWAQGAAAVLPITNMAEDEGTFTNLRGRVQRFLQAKQAPGFARPAWSVFSDLLTALGESAIYFAPSEVFGVMAKSVPALAGLSYDSLGLRGAETQGAAR